YTKKATSNKVTVTAAATYSVTASPSSVNGGANVNVSWTAPAGSSTTDWIGMAKVGSPDDSYVTWKSTGGAASGTMVLVAPADGGDYEFRYFLNNGFTKKATSNKVTVNAAATYTLAASPNNPNPGANVTANWTAPAGSSTTD